MTRRWQQYSNIQAQTKDCNIQGDRKEKLSLPGAIIISFFLERTLRKVRSFCASMSLTVLRAFITSWWRRPAYCTVLELSRVVLIGMPSERREQERSNFSFFKLCVNVCVCNLMLPLLYNVKGFSMLIKLLET